MRISEPKPNAFFRNAYNASKVQKSAIEEMSCDVALAHDLLAQNNE